MQQFDIASLSAGENLACDVCIVGSGPAGMAIARELSGGKLAVMLVESGDFERQAPADALNEVENIGWPRVEDQWLVRNRVVGGSSHTWSGRCVPFDAIDYEQRDWVPYSGWPISQEALTPYMDRSAPHLGISIGGGYGEAQFWSLAKRRRPVPPFDTRLLDSYFWAFSKDPANAREHMRFAWHMREWLGANITLVTNATVCRVNMDETGRVANSVEIAAPDGQRHQLAAKIIVLCAGGIENPRLLLCSGPGKAADLRSAPDNDSRSAHDRDSRSAPGNAGGQVGRFLMDHLRGEVGTFSLQGTRRLRRQFGHYRWADGQVFAHGMQLSPALQREEGLVNCTAWLEGRITADDPYNVLKRLAKGKPQLPADAIALFGNIGLLTSGLWDYYIARGGLPRKIERLVLVAMCEQIPDPDSRVTLADTQDVFGVPRARIDWRVHDVEARTLRRMARLVAQEFARMQLPKPDLEDWVRDDADLPATFQDVAHPTGTTRMGDGPETSVVDANCQVHDTKNLYIAGSSVFPTSSHANPTQTILALAIRLADRLNAGARMDSFDSDQTGGRVDARRTA